MSDNVIQFPKIVITPNVPTTRKGAFDAYLELCNYQGSKRAPKFGTFSAGASWAATLIHNVLSEAFLEVERSGVLDLSAVQDRLQEITDIVAMRREGMAYAKEDAANEQ